MTCQLIAVWRDEDSDERIHRYAHKFPTTKEAEAHILYAKDIGILRVDHDFISLDNGANLLASFIPFHQIIGFYLWSGLDSDQQEEAK